MLTTATFNPARLKPESKFGKIALLWNRTYYTRAQSSVAASNSTAGNNIIYIFRNTASSYRYFWPFAPRGRVTPRDCYGTGEI